MGEKERKWKVLICFFAVTLFVLPMGIINSAETQHLQAETPVTPVKTDESSMSDNLDSKIATGPDIEVTDISFSFMSIVATVKNNGVNDANTNVVFTVRKGALLPITIGNHEVTIPARETIEVKQRFVGVGQYTFSVSTGESSLNTRGFWILFIGIEN